MEITYWIPVRTIAAKEKDKWLECSNCGNEINMYDIENLRFEYANNPEVYENERRAKYCTCEKCGSEMDTDISYEIRKRRFAKGDYGLEEAVKKILEYRNKKEV